MNRVELHEGDCLETLRTLPDNSVDSVVTDPPYHLTSIVKRFGGANSAPAKVGQTGAFARASRGFMGQTWDGGDIAFRPELWAEVLRVLKPGGHLAAFSGTRTYHRMAVAIEDAGFEIRDQLAWTYGCLDEQTQVAMADGVRPYHMAKAGDLVLCYDVQTGGYSYQPILEVVEYDYADTAYRLVGDFGEQVVSRNHRCIVERGGSEVFQFAETLQREARVPVLEDLRGLQHALCDARQIASGTEHHLRAGLQSAVDQQSEDRADHSARETRWTAYRLRGVWDGGLEAGCLAEADQEANMRAPLQRDAARAAVGDARPQGPREVDASFEGRVEGSPDRGDESFLERRADLSQSEGRLLVSGDQVCPLPAALCVDVETGRLRDGAPAFGGTGAWSSTDPLGSGSSSKSRCNGQRADELDALRDKRRAQVLRTRGRHRTAVVRVVPFHYVGKVWCLRVPTGAFVAVRNGVAFPTGNSGFPKSHDVSKGIDKRRDDSADILRITTALADAAEQRGLSRGAVDAAMGTSDMAGWWLSRLQHRCQCPRWDQWTQLKELVGLGDGYDADVWRLNGRKGEWGEAAKERGTIEATGGLHGGSGNTVGKFTGRQLAPNAILPEAQRWQGWGTALKPAWEPICLARKPLAGTVAENVLTHGVGALNVDGCRIEGEGGQVRIGEASQDRRYADLGGTNFAMKPGPRGGDPAGRWPANILHDGEAGFGEQGRFFYCAKASKADREDGNNHPTVKPTDLMRWLCRLITPPGGVVLDPFTGSGSTGKAAVLEGFGFIGMELSAEYAAIARRRITGAGGVFAVPVVSVMATDKFECDGIFG